MQVLCIAGLRLHVIRVQQSRSTRIICQLAMLSGIIIRHFTAVESSRLVEASVKARGSKRNQTRPRAHRALDALDSLGDIHEDSIPALKMLLNRECAHVKWRGGAPSRVHGCHDTRRRRRLGCAATSAVVRTSLHTATQLSLLLTLNMESAHKEESTGSGVRLPPPSYTDAPAVSPHRAYHLPRSRHQH